MKVNNFYNHNHNFNSNKLPIKKVSILSKSIILKAMLWLIYLYMLDKVIHYYLIIMIYNLPLNLSKLIRIFQRHYKEKDYLY